MKRILGAMLLALLMNGPRPAFAWHGHQGPQGEQGVAGQNGANGADGVNGLNGLNGRDGINGRDAETHTKVVGGVDARLLDYEYMDLRVFDDYNLRDGRNDAVGVRVGFKIGESWETREMASMRREIMGLMATLDGEITKRDKAIAELKSVAHRPGVHQEYYYGEFSDKMRLYDKDGKLQ